MPNQYSPPRVCSIDGCGKPHKARGWCRTHYAHWQKYGHPIAAIQPRGTLAERFWSKVNKDGPTPAHRPDLGPCWGWTAGTNQDGYGRIGAGGASGTGFMAHRVSYEMVNEPIPDGFELDHLCSNRRCVNPAHLETVTHRENIMRGQSLFAVNARKTHCKHGHEFTPETTYVSTAGRACKTCKHINDAKRRASHS